MKVSIITSVYNNEETIEDAINSVITQNYKDIEYIIIDGASSDGTMEVIKKYENSISKIISEKDNGIYDGLNKGVNTATGDIICFLHSDDIYPSSDTVSQIVYEFENDKTLDAIYGDLVYTNKKDTTKILRYWKSQNFNLNLLSKGWMPAHPTFIVKKEIYEKYGNFNLSFKIAADYDFMLRVLKNNIIVKYIPTVLYKMRIGGESNKSIKNIILKSKEDLHALKKNNIGGIFSLLIKNFSKIKQFIVKN